MASETPPPVTTPASTISASRGVMPVPNSGSSASGERASPEVVLRRVVAARPSSTSGGGQDQRAGADRGNGHGRPAPQESTQARVPLAQYGFSDAPICDAVIVCGGARRPGGAAPAPAAAGPYRTAAAAGAPAAPPSDPSTRAPPGGAAPR